MTRHPHLVHGLVLCSTLLFIGCTGKYSETYSVQNKAAHIGAAFAPLGKLGGPFGLAAPGFDGLMYQLKDRGIDVQERGDIVIVVMQTDRIFGVRAETIDEDRYSDMFKVTELVKYHSSGPIHVSAYTDNIGSKSENMQLTQHQADAIASFLWSRGVSFRRLSAQGYGSYHPSANNLTTMGSYLNRRIEIRFNRG